MTTKKYYWVNQGRTWKAERSKGFLWAPFLTRGKHERDDWIILKRLNPGDIIFSYVTPNLLAYSIVTNKWIEFDRPREFDKNLPWTKEGMRVDVKYVDFNPIKVDSDFKKNVLAYKDTFDDGKDWIFDINMKIKQKYLMPLSLEFGKYLTNLIKAPEIEIDDYPDAEDDGNKPKKPKPKKGQGYSQRKRKTIELYAMEVVRDLFEINDYIVDDVSDIRPSYGCDFICIPKKSGKGIVYCEVKGLEGSPDYVFVTRNEYLKSKEYGENSALYIVHNIDCDESDPPVASGGEVLFFHPWEPNDPENCEPHTYKFYPDDY